MWIIPALPNAPFNLLSTCHSFELLESFDPRLDFIRVILEYWHGLIGVVLVLGKVWCELFKVNSGKISSISLEGTYR